MLTKRNTTKASATPWSFHKCEGYAFLGMLDPKVSYLSKCGLEGLTKHKVTNPRALRFWFVKYPVAFPEGDPASRVSYEELSMAFLVDVRDFALSCTKSAWHLPRLFVTDPTPLQVGKVEFGFPKELAHVDIRVGDGVFEVRDPQDNALIWGIEASKLDFVAITPNLSLGPFEAWRSDILSFQPRCFQLRGKKWVSPRLEVDGPMRISIATAAVVTYRPRDLFDPIGLPFSSTGFVLKTEFDLKLRLERSVCS